MSVMHLILRSICRNYDPRLLPIKQHNTRLHCWITATRNRLGGDDGMSKRTEWNLLKKEFDALTRNESVRPDHLEELFDHQIRRRFGQLISKAMGQQSDFGLRSQVNP